MASKHLDALPPPKVEAAFSGLVPGASSAELGLWAGGVGGALVDAAAWARLVSACGLGMAEGPDVPAAALAWGETVLFIPPP